ncbi:LicD family protein [Parabacteroides goldsteinii]|uniref:LicD family protein n=1 Tax=Parabacteroides goldsteinii TaxID=328812 RepID=UPI001897D2BB|nr:LicD family protein [Parabacteroides goldsteinii]
MKCKELMILKPMQKVQLELLHELDRVCKKNNLKYCLSSGTCLGALRHGGFIPWDDDIDVYMSWRDAEKLVKCQSDFQNKYFVQSYKTDVNFYSTSYRLCDSSTSCFLKGNEGIDMNHGIFIDIYIYYPYPDNKLKAQKIIFYSFIYRFLIARSISKRYGLLDSILNLFFRGKRRENIIKKIENEYHENGGKMYVATYFGRDIGLFKSIVYPIDWFDNPRYLKFENMDVPCPGDTERYCELQYGKNFMELPSIEKRIPHHDFLYFSVDEPYTKFKGIYY